MLSYFEATKAIRRAAVLLLCMKVICICNRYPAYNLLLMWML